MADDSTGCVRSAKKFTFAGEATTEIGCFLQALPYFGEFSIKTRLVRRLSYYDEAVRCYAEFANNF